MPFFYEITHLQSIHAAVWHITETVDELLTIVQPDEEDRLTCESFKNNLRKKQWLACRALLSHLLSPMSVKLFYDPNGKPLLFSGTHHISVSHAGGYAAAVISPCGKVGIDIEHILPRIERVKERFINNEELAALSSSPSLELLYYYWCCKEALYKLHGSHSVDFRNDIRIKPIDYLCATKGTGKATLVFGTKFYEYAVYYEKIDEFMIAVAY
ncbi:MAG: 4'-phosphopantetheinyl transferase superfamily protein [Bacteroidetes bacterium]|nr:4'-phosphopantetheinyl transferase superfamily protein [Bacteroidota bacterium]